MWWIFYAVAGLIVLLLLWPKIRNLLPAAWSGTVTGAIGTASDYATDAVTQAAFTTLAGAGWANDDLTFLAKLAECRQMQKKWGVPPAVAPPSSDYAMETLRAQVAALTRVVASQSVSVPPAASTGTGA